MIDKINKEDLKFFNMPKVSLLALLDLEFNKALKIELKIVNDWIKNKRCKCVEHPDIQSKRISLNCKHLNKVIEKAIGDFNIKIRRMSNVLLIRNLLEAKLKLRKR